MIGQRPPSELSRPLRLAAIPTGGYQAEVIANPEECHALARRFGLPSIEALSCSFTLAREPGATIRASGVLCARVTQLCRVTLDPFPASVAELFTVRFVPEGKESVAFDPEAADEIPYTGGTFDLGEAAAEQFALALDPVATQTGRSVANPVVGMYEFHVGGDIHLPS